MKEVRKEELIRLINELPEGVVLHVVLESEETKDGDE